MVRTSTRLAASLVLGLLFVCAVLSSPTHAEAVVARDADPIARHAALLHRSFDAKFKHGVFPADLSAILAIRAADAPRLAGIEKRQNGTAPTSQSQQRPPTTPSTVQQQPTTVTLERTRIKINHNINHRNRNLRRKQNNNNPL